MEFLSVFSIMDFLAYLFPGILATIGLYLLLILTPLKSSVQLSLDSFGGRFFMILISYIIGVINSGITDRVFRGSEDSNRASDIKGNIHIGDTNLENEIKDAVASYIFEGKKKFKQADSYESNRIYSDFNYCRFCMGRRDRRKYN